MIRTGADLKAARRALGWSLRDMAEELRLGSDGERFLRKMECGGRSVTGPVAIAVEFFLAEAEREDEE